MSNAEHALERFGELCIRKNFPLHILARSREDLSVVLSALIGREDPRGWLTEDAAQEFLSTSGKWLAATPAELAEVFNQKGFIDCSRAFKDIDLEAFVEKKREEERRRFEERALFLERRSAERKLSNPSRDEFWMSQAIDLAREAKASGEVPVGAVLVLGDKAIGKGRNSVISLKDPTAHAEILAIRAAAQNLDNFRLEDCELFVTLEPCPMCAGAILNSRIKRVVYGAKADEENRACGSEKILKPSKHDSIPYVKAGVLAQECAKILRDFFEERRG